MLVPPPSSYQARCHVTRPVPCEFVWNHTNCHDDFAYSCMVCVIFLLVAHYHIVIWQCHIYSVSCSDLLFNLLPDVGWFLTLTCWLWLWLFNSDCLTLTFSLWLRKVTKIKVTAAKISRISFKIIFPCKFQSFQSITQL